jgi:hypothetical protein
MKVTIKGAIWAVKYSWSEGLFYSFDDTDHHDPRYVKVMDHELTVEVPDDFDMRPGMVANLEREKEKAKADFTARVTQINAQIQSLLAIEA